MDAPKVRAGGHALALTFAEKSGAATPIRPESENDRCQLFQDVGGATLMLATPSPVHQS